MPRLIGRGSSQSKVTGLAVFFLFLAVSFLLVSLGGCASRGAIQNVKLPFITVKKIVISRLPLSIVREESANGRELTSVYFNPNNFEEEALDRSERAYAKVVILGAGRPYSIAVKVYREKRKKGTTYGKAIEDKKLTNELIDRIREALADRREDRNIIDDFRPF